MADNIVHLPTPVAADPALGELLAFKGVYALCSVDKTGKVLKATHYASVLVGGSQPIWGVWLVTGKFLRFFGFRSEIEEFYPKLAWRRKVATWTCMSIADKSVATRRAELEARYGKPLPERS